MFRRLCAGFACALLLCSSSALLAQDAAFTPSTVSVVPHFVKYSGTLPDAPAAASVVEVKFAMYAAQTGGEALWTETQQVALDPQSKYSVLLGATAAAGLPQKLFANGESRWMGVTLAGQAESPRTLLAATPYSLKASDAETLSGHPVSDFKLKNASPETVDVTSITAGPGIIVTNNGTASPTVAINGAYAANYAQLAAANVFKASQTIDGSLVVTGNISIGGTIMSSYLDSLGALYAPLKGNNSFSGTNKFTKAVTFANSQTFPGTATLAGANTFSGTGNTFTNAVTVGGTLISSGQILENTSVGGVYAADFINAAADSGGAIGEAPTNGLAGAATDATVGDESIGVYGSSANTQGIGVEGLATVGADSYGVYGVLDNPSVEGQTYQSEYGQLTAGIWADTDITEANSAGNTAALLVTADDAVGGIFAVNSPTGYAPLQLIQDNTSGYILFGINTANSAECLIDGSADLTCSGTLAGSNATAENRKVQTYAVQSSENWIEDFGSGQLSSGSAVITLDPAFKEIVNTGVAYHVYLTPNGDSKGLYVTAKGPGSFEVHESNGGHASIPFDYRIVAKHKGTEGLRLADITDKMKNPILGKKMTDSEKAAKLAQMQHQRQQAQLLPRAQK